MAESTYVCVDNSEYQRNGDMVPTRMSAEIDAANIVLHCKLRANPANAVGLLSMADEVRVLSILTNQWSKLFSKLQQIKPIGRCKFLVAIQIARLALKHRRNKSPKSRIVLFVGSPISENKDELVELATVLRKSKVSVDAICFGECLEENGDKLSAFIKVLNAPEEAGSSHLVMVQAGSVLKEAVMMSPVCKRENGTVPQIDIDMALGVNPEEDPELATALRESIQDAQLPLPNSIEDAAAPSENPFQMDEDSQIVEAIFRSLHPVTAVRTADESESSTEDDDSEDLSVTADDEDDTQDID